MPNSKQHREKAEHNRAFLATIDVKSFPDWASVVAFYAAVHLVERLRAKTNEHSVNHEDRIDFLHGKPYRSTIFAAYHVLFNASLIARYETASSFATQFAASDVQSILIDRNLVTIEKFVAASFAPPAP
jgi:hypothetical protein